MLQTITLLNEIEKVLTHLHNVRKGQEYIEDFLPPADEKEKNRANTKCPKN
jgi:hypothetical protein